MTDTPMFQPISLGFSCEVKYQLSRVLYERRFGQAGSEHDFRQRLLTPSLGQETFERHIFDWQITPFEALLAWLENDFQGVFERADLHPSPDSSGNLEVEHRVLKTRHPHDFHAVDGVLDAAAIDAQYEAARGKFEHLAAKFRRLLEQPGDHLYVFRQIRIYDDAVKLMRLLGARAPDHRFKLLFVDTDGLDQTLTALDGEVFRAWLPERADKPGDRTWEGDDARWDGILAGYALSQPEKAPPEPAAEAPRPRGLLSRLMRRCAT